MRRISLLFWKKKSDVTLVVGLGNPGPGYAQNRHNTGFMCVDHIARSSNIRLNKNEGQARTGAGEISGKPVVLAMPLTFVNRSGQAVNYLVRKHRVTHDRLIVIHDDLDLLPGKIRIRLNGSAGGHRGISSIANSIGGRDFIRVRIGIGRPEPSGNKDADVVDYVLGDMTPEEQNTLNEIFPRIDEIIRSILAEGLEATMNRFN